MKSSITVFTSPTCPHCHSAVTLVKRIKEKRDDVTIQIANTADPKWVALARKYQVFSVPTIFIKGSYHEVLAIKGTTSEDKINEMIDISLGKKQIEEPIKGFFKNLFS